MQLLLWKCQILNFTLLLNLKEGTFLLLGFCISILLSLLRPSLLLQFEFGLSGKKKRSRWLQNRSQIAIVFAPLFFYKKQNIFEIGKTTVTQRNDLCCWLRVMDWHMTTSLFLFWTMHHQLVWPQKATIRYSSINFNHWPTSHESEILAPGLKSVWVEEGWSDLILKKMRLEDILLSYFEQIVSFCTQIQTNSSYFVKNIQQL